MVRSRSIVGSIVHYVVLVAILAVMVGPLVWMARVALLDKTATLSPDSLLSTAVTLQNFIDLFTQSGMARYMFNSLFVAVAVTVGNIIFCVMVGWVLARHRSWFTRLLFVSVVIVLMIPVHIVIIPLYLICLKGGIYDTYWALILPFLINPIGIFLARQYIETIPPSMEEAARVDGASEARILFTIVMPMAKPAIAVLGVLAFITNWNSFLFPFILTSSESMRTLPVALAMLQGHQAIDWQHLMAGSTLAVLPVLALFFIMQRQIVSGVTAGGIKQ
ncbi:ABC transporter permease subunit [candidate division GN15 bacterium]|nr:ABC transporter permease subunit [candidate division GN15 bacterium]